MAENGKKVGLPGAMGSLRRSIPTCLVEHRAQSYTCLNHTDLFTIFSTFNSLLFQQCGRNTSVLPIVFSSPGRQT